MSKDKRERTKTKARPKPKAKKVATSNATIQRLRAARAEVKQLKAELAQLRGGVSVEAQPPQDFGYADPVEVEIEVPADHPPGHPPPSGEQ